MNPIAPVAQNEHPNLQPTCVETHPVILSSSLSSTASMRVRPYSSSSFRVPSTSDVRVSTTLAQERTAFSDKRSRRAFERFVISSKLRTPLLNTQSAICPAR